MALCGFVNIKLLNFPRADDKRQRRCHCGRPVYGLGNGRAGGSQQQRKASAGQAESGGKSLSIFFPFPTQLIATIPIPSEKSRIYCIHFAVCFTLPTTNQTPSPSVCVDKTVPFPTFSWKNARNLGQLDRKQKIGVAQVVGSIQRRPQLKASSRRR